MANSYTIILTLALLLTLWGCERPTEPPASVGKGVDPRAVIVAAGDSLTAGFGVREEESYPAQLGRRLQAAGLDYRVVNAGASGETSSGLLSRLEWLLTMKPAIVIVATGANDGLRGIDPALTKANIKEIIARLKGRGVTVLLTGMRMVENLGPQYTEAFNRIYPELAQESNVLFVPFLLEGVAADPALNLVDGIHPNGKGYRAVVENLYPSLLKAIDRRQQGGDAPAP